MFERPNLTPAVACVVARRDAFWKYRKWLAHAAFSGAMRRLVARALARATWTIINAQGEQA
jgi:hypothetical protein